MDSKPTITPKYFLSILLGFFLGWLIFLILVIYQIGTPVSGGLRNIHETDLYKQQYANLITQPKIVVMAGSNALYGVSCEMIETTTKIPCVNAAITQELGLDYMFKHTHKFLNSGDTLIVPLEYHQYISDGSKYSQIATGYILAYDQEYLNTFNLWQKFSIIGGISYQRLFQGLMGKLQPPKSLQTLEELKINKQGDRTDNQFIAITNLLKQTINEIKPMAFSDWHLTPYAQQQIKSLADWSKDNNITLLFTWPSIINFPEYEQPKDQKFIQEIESFYQKNGLTVLGKPQDFMYEKTWFWDSAYHLHDKAREERTKQIINLIKPYLPK